MHYLMLVRVDPALAASVQDSDPDRWVEEGTRSGMRVEGRPLEDVTTATTVQVRKGETLISDGPFVETTEVVAGYDLLQAPDLEAALDYAGRHPVASFGAVEVREIWEDFVDERDAAAPPLTETGVDYLFLHVPDPDLLASATRETADPTAWVRDVEDRGITIGGARLRDEASAQATVRVRDGETLVTRGPFAEVAEQIAGIDRLRVPDLDAAIALAATHPTSRVGTIEIRPLAPE